MITQATNDFINSLENLEAHGITCEVYALNMRDLKATLAFNEKAFIHTQLHMNPLIRQTVFQHSKIIKNISETLNADVKDIGAQITSLLKSSSNPIAKRYISETERIKRQDKENGINFNRSP